MSNEFVMVPRDAVKDLVELSVRDRKFGARRDEVRKLLADDAAPYSIGEPEAWIVKWADDGSLYMFTQDKERSEKLRNDPSFSSIPLYAHPTRREPVEPFGSLLLVAWHHLREFATDERPYTKNLYALIEEALEFIDDGVGRSDAEWQLIQKLRTSIFAITEPGDRSYANKASCPECGEAFGEATVPPDEHGGRQPWYEVGVKLAEPSAPKFNRDTVVCRRYELGGRTFFHFDDKCVYDSAPVTLGELLDAMRPIEIDERAAFEKELAAKGRTLTGADYDPDAYGNAFDDGAWTGWLVRAALERKS